MKKIGLSDFREQCFALMDDLPAEGILVTRDGHPIAKLIPVKKSCAALIGSGSVLYDNDDDLFSTGERWHSST